MSNKTEGILSIIGGVGYGIYTLYNRTTSSDYALSLLMSGERGASVFAKAESYGATQDKFFYFNIALSVALIGVGIYYIFYKKDYYCPHCKSKIMKGVTKCPHCTSDIINKNNQNHNKNIIQKNNLDNNSQSNGNWNNVVYTKTTLKETIPIKVENRFIGNKDISNDSYKIFLVDKYKVTKNDVFNKFVYQDKLYESIDELLLILDSEEKILNSTPKLITEPQTSDDEYIVMATKNKLSQLGYVITENKGVNGNRKFTLRKGNKTEYFYSAKELIDYSNSSM